jgi:hypothetical protein
MHRVLLTAAACLIAAAALSDGAAPAPAPAPAPRTRAEIDKRLGELTNRQLELTYTLSEAVKKLDSLWLDEHLTSPEIEALRRKRAALLHELGALETALRREIAAQPAYADAQKQLDDDRAAFQAMGREIEDLKRRRASAP